MPDQIVRISEGAIAQEVNGETVILDLNSQQYFSLDKTGTRIWQLLQEKLNTREVYQEMRNEYEVDEEELRQDIDSLIASLVEEGLVSLADN